MGKEEKKKKAFHVDSTPLLRLSSGVNPTRIIFHLIIIAFFSYFRKVRTRSEEEEEDDDGVVELMKRWPRGGRR